MIPNHVTEWLAQQGYGAVVAQVPITGGCISNGLSLETKSGSRFFLKTNSLAPEDMFIREAEGLAAIRDVREPRVPQSFLSASDFLLLEDMQPTAPSDAYWPRLGRQLARLHQVTHSKFGFPHDNYIGSTPQPNLRTSDGFEFFAEHRLIFQARLARNAGLLESAAAANVEKLAHDLRNLVPDQPASLIHGDLWSGNAITDSRGEPVLIDPAVHYGWAEAELGMTTMFGGFAREFYVAYQEIRSLETGWQERLPIYNLYHWLNHLNLFGPAYRSQVEAVLNRFL
ncbi:MAG: fructosamine kinase family protein [Chloroflexi bacterium]|nr:fructosamine kinase family protein [Chloroflexota bacterium]